MITPHFKPQREDKPDQNFFDFPLWARKPALQGMAVQSGKKRASIRKLFLDTLAACDYDAFLRKSAIRPSIPFLSKIGLKVDR